MTECIMWAQALDNISPDEFELTGAKLTREAAVSRVYRVIERGKRLYAVNGIQLTVHGGEVVLEVMSTARDQIGRSAPIICWSRYENKSSDQFATFLITQIEQFANHIERGLVLRHAENINDAINALKKKFRVQKTLKMGFVLAAALIAIVLVYGIFFGKSSTRNSGPSTQLNIARILPA